MLLLHWTSRVKREEHSILSWLQVQLDFKPSSAAPSSPSNQASPVPPTDLLLSPPLHLCTYNFLPTDYPAFSSSILNIMRPPWGVKTAKTMMAFSPLSHLQKIYSVNCKFQNLTRVTINSVLNSEENRLSGSWLVCSCPEWLLPHINQDWIQNQQNCKPLHTAEL